FSLPQWVFDHATDTVSAANPKITLKVKVPPCFSQVDLVAGSELIKLLEDHKLYGGRILGSRAVPGSLSSGDLGTWRGGEKACVAPAVTSQSACDSWTGTVPNRVGGRPV